MGRWNGLSLVIGHSSPSVGYRAIISTNDDFSVITPQRTDFNEKKSKLKIAANEIGNKIIVCNFVTIFSSLNNFFYHEQSHQSISNDNKPVITQS